MPHRDAWLGPEVAGHHRRHHILVCLGASLTTTIARPAVVADRPAGTHVAMRILGVLLCAAVIYAHIKDQNGFPGEKADDSATWVQIGYYLIEGVGLVAALMLLFKVAVRTAWVLALGVGAGPLVGYILSRWTGLPQYSGDKGHWFGDP